jgi:hypothetical protein
VGATSGSSDCFRVLLFGDSDLLKLVFIVVVIVVVIVIGTSCYWPDRIIRV